LLFLDVVYMGIMKTRTLKLKFKLIFVENTLRTFEYIHLQKIEQPASGRILLALIKQHVTLLAECSSHDLWPL